MQPRQQSSRRITTSRRPAAVATEPAAVAPPSLTRASSNTRRVIAHKAAAAAAAAHIIKQKKKNNNNIIAGRRWRRRSNRTRNNRGGSRLRRVRSGTFSARTPRDPPPRPTRNAFLRILRARPSLAAQSTSPSRRKTIFSSSRARRRTRHRRVWFGFRFRSPCTESLATNIIQRYLIVFFSLVRGDTPCARCQDNFFVLFWFFSFVPVTRMHIWIRPRSEHKPHRFARSTHI